MSLFRCPICCAPLVREGRVYRCPSGHSYDIAREGYVHLLPPNKKHSKTPGDDKDMVAARVRFLTAGYYEPLRRALEEAAVRYAEEGVCMLDSGCGEGYYTAGIAQALRQAGKAPRTAGIDLSKSALRHAARRDKETEFAVASAYHLPVADASMDLIVNCFSPMAGAEFLRVLRPGGRLLYVVPAPDHLWELKEVLYETPYPNPEEDVLYPGFSTLGERKVENTLTISDHEDLMALFRMTPYCWKTPREGIARLEGLDRLTVRASFRVLAFQKEG